MRETPAGYHSSRAAFAVIAASLVIAAPARRIATFIIARSLGARPLYIGVTPASCSIRQIIDNRSRRQHASAPIIR